MKKDPIRVDSKLWTDGGEPLGTTDVQRKGAVFLIFLLGAVFSLVLLGLGLVLDRMPTPLGFASRAEPLLHYGGALLWLTLASVFARCMPWAGRRPKANYRNVRDTQPWAFLEHFAGKGTPRERPRD